LLARLPALITPIGAQTIVFQHGIASTA